MDTPQVVQIRPARQEPRVDHTVYDDVDSWEPRGMIRGLSESDFMLRQRYVENSGHRDSCSQSVSIASHPIEPNLISSIEVHNFVQEQRKIIANFRAQPWPMEMKIAALKAYRQNLSKYANQMNAIDTVRDTSKLMMKKLCYKFDNFLMSITIWNSIIKQIEGRFGSSVASFFTFLRWLCAVNLLLTIMILGFLVIPQKLGGHGLEVPQSVMKNGSAFSFFFDGKGYVFEYSVLFYGYYDSGLNEPPPHNPKIGWGYKLPLAYLLVVIAMFVICVVAILFNMAKKYKLLQRANVSEQYLFAWKLFAVWDHTVTNSDTAAAKGRHIATALKETILEAEKNADKGIKWRYLLFRILCQVVVSLILLGSCYVIFLAVEKTETGTSTTSVSQAINAGSDGLVMFLSSFRVQAVVITRNMLLPYLFKLAEILERYHPRTALKVLLIRLFVLYISSLYVLIIALLTYSKQCRNDDSNNNNSTVFQPWSAIGLKEQSREEKDNEELCCWETIIGQELYKLSLTHLFADLVSILFNDVTRWAIVQGKLCPKLAKLVGMAEFNLAENILKLVYGQALVWLGALFCPLLPVINFIKNILLFYTRAIVVSIFNKPPRTMFRVASTRNFYMALLLVMTFLCVFPVGYAIMQLTPSQMCGPFRGLPSMITILTYEIDSWPSLIRKIVRYIQTPTVVISFIALLCIVIYYYSTLSGALKEVNKDLRIQLHMEQKETKDRIAKDAHEQPSRVSSMKNRHKALQKQMRIEQQQTQRNFQPSPSPSPSSQTSSPSSLRYSIASPSTSQKKRVRVREVPDDFEMDHMIPYSPNDIETGWSPLPHSTIGYVDVEHGRTIRQTTL